MLRIDGWSGAGKGRATRVRGVVGNDRAGEPLWSAPFKLPGDYIEQHAELAYAGNVHVAQSSTVDDYAPGRGRHSLARGVLRRHEPRPPPEHGLRDHRARPRRRPCPRTPASFLPRRPRSSQGRSAAAAPASGAGWSAGTAAGWRTATESVRRELDRAASLATLAPIWTDVTRAHATGSMREPSGRCWQQKDWQQYQLDTERGTLTRRRDVHHPLAECGGHCSCRTGVHKYLGAALLK